MIWQKWKDLGWEANILSSALYLLILRNNKYVSHWQSNWMDYDTNHLKVHYILMIYTSLQHKSICLNGSTLLSYDNAMSCSASYINKPFSFHLIHPSYGPREISPFKIKSMLNILCLFHSYITCVYFTKTWW